MSMMLTGSFQLLVTDSGIQIYECFSKAEALKMADQDGFSNVTWLMAIHDADELDEAVIRFTQGQGVETRESEVPNERKTREQNKDQS